MITTLNRKWFNKKSDLIIGYLPNIPNYLRKRKGEIKNKRLNFFYPLRCLNTRIPSQLK